MAQDTAGTYFMNWAEGTSPLTLAVFTRRSEKVRRKVYDTVRMDNLVWSLYDATRPQWWTHHAKGADEVFNVIAALNQPGAQAPTT